MAIQHLNNGLISASDLVMPVFLKSGNSIRHELKSLPGITAYSVDKFKEEIGKITDKGISNLALIEISSDHDSFGSAVDSDNSAILHALSALKDSHPQLRIFTDLCLCQYTDHGHCGVLNNGLIDNDETLRIIEKVAIKYAEAGADILMPSGMLDGVIGRLRHALDSNGFPRVALMNQSAKFASSYFGPFRKSAHSQDAAGISKTSYQVPYSNGREALREIACDVEEGADFIMVKPALAYLDIIQAAKQKFSLPLAAFCTSGEFNMIKLLAGEHADSRSAIIESLSSVKRAGADLLITYFAEEIAATLN